MLFPRKAYVIDTGLINVVSFKFSENIGRLMENLVFFGTFKKKLQILRP
ncbi:MAG: hypothetical protein PWP19_804 [Thermococcaceae archaeon]|jgi:hypothetical protein|nr:hypothetical protein [Thermococcaceae archaeon]